MRQGQVLQLEIPSSPEFVAIVRRAVDGLARRMRFDTDKLNDINLAVGEACTNAVKYGCPCDDTHDVEVRCIVTDAGLCIEIRNILDGNEVPHIPDKVMPSENGGMGLYMIRQLMDEFCIEQEQTRVVVRMLKKLGTQEMQKAS